MSSNENHLAQYVESLLNHGFDRAELEGLSLEEIQLFATIDEEDLPTVPDGFSEVGTSKEYTAAFMRKLSENRDQVQASSSLREEGESCTDVVLQKQQYSESISNWNSDVQIRKQIHQSVVNRNPSMVSGGSFSRARFEDWASFEDAYIAAHI